MSKIENVISEKLIFCRKSHFPPIMGTLTRCQRHVSHMIPSLQIALALHSSLLSNSSTHHAASAMSAFHSIMVLYHVAVSPRQMKMVWFDCELQSVRTTVSLKNLTPQMIEKSPRKS